MFSLSNSLYTLSNSSEFSSYNSFNNESRVKIPKIIMQTWKTHNVPDHWKSSPESIKKLMPDWRYILLSDDDNYEFMKKYFPEYLDVYESLEYSIMKADLIRYAFLYIHGGIYLDLDIEITKPLDELFHKRGDIYLVESGNAGGIYTNSFMASKPKCKFWLDCLREIRKDYKWWAYGKHLRVMSRTGPLMLTRVVNKTKHKLVKIPRKYVMPCSTCDLKPCTKPGAYTKALEGSSWCDWDSYVYNKCLCNWKKILFIILIFVLIIIYLFFW